MDNVCSRDLDLDAITLIYELDPCPLEIYRMCEKKSYVDVSESYRSTDIQADIHIRRQTDSTEIIYHAASREGDE